MAEREHSPFPLLRSPLVDANGYVRDYWFPWFEGQPRVQTGIDEDLGDVEETIEGMQQSVAIPARARPEPDGSEAVPVQQREMGRLGVEGAVARAVAQAVAAQAVDQALRGGSQALAVGYADRLGMRPGPYYLRAARAALAGTGRLLAQQRATTAATVLYQPSSSLVGVIEQIVVANTTSTNTTYQLFLDIDGLVYDENSSLFWDIAISGNSSDVVPVWLPMGSTAGMAIAASANDRLTVTIGGYEMPVDSWLQERPLGQARPPVLNTPVSIFSPSPGVRAKARGLLVSNVAGGGKAATYSVYLDHDGSTYNDTTALAREASLNAGTTDILLLALSMDDENGNFAVETNDVANEVNFTLFGTLEPK